jgi:hypothetical protein
LRGRGQARLGRATAIAERDRVSDPDDRWSDGSDRDPSDRSAHTSAFTIGSGRAVTASQVRTVTIPGADAISGDRGAGCAATSPAVPLAYRPHADTECLFPTHSCGWLSERATGDYRRLKVVDLPVAAPSPGLATAFDTLPPWQNGLQPLLHLLQWRRVRPLAQLAYEDTRDRTWASFRLHNESHRRFHPNDSSLWGDQGWTSDPKLMATYDPFLPLA